MKIYFCCLATPTRSTSAQALVGRLDFRLLIVVLYRDSYFVFPLFVYPFALTLYSTTRLQAACDLVSSFVKSQRALRRDFPGVKDGGRSTENYIGGGCDLTCVYATIHKQMKLYAH